MVEVEIRRLEEGDAPQAVEIEKRSFSSPWPGEDLISKIRSNGIYLAAVKEDRVLGFIGCDVVLDEGHIARLAVDTDFRGKGIGRKLVGALIDLAKGESIKDLLLEVRASNIISKRLYESFGFKIVRTRKEYYSGPTEDALVMEKKIETD